MGLSLAGIVSFLLSLSQVHGREAVAQRANVHSQQQE